MMHSLSHILVLTTLPDHETADTIGRELVEARLAACVSVGAPVKSMYHWQGVTQTAQEIPVTVKTRAELFEQVATFIRARHPYELPEIVAVPISDGHPDYLAWIDAGTGPH